MMNTPTDREVRDWYMGYGVEGRAELAEVEGNAFDRYLLERDARVSKATEERIAKLLEDYQSKKCNDYECFSVFNRNTHDYECGVDELQRLIALVKGENK